MEIIHILSYNRLDILKKNIEAIEKYCEQPYKLIIVDDCSTDKKVLEYLDKLKQRYEVWINSKNLGFAGAYNSAIVHSIDNLSFNCDYIMHLDNDIIVEDYSWNKKLISCMEKNKEIGLLSLNFPGCNLRIDRGDWEETDWVLGGCSMIRTQTLQDLYLLWGYYLDERLKYQLEADLCLRIRMSGYKVGYIKGIDVDISHSGKFSIEEGDKFIEKVNIGTMQFSQKWNRYFGGKNFNYYDNTNLRWQDYPINQKFYKDFFRSKGYSLNENPEVIKIDNFEYDIIKEIKDKNYYRDNYIGGVSNRCMIYNKYKDELEEEWR